MAKEMKKSIGAKKTAKAKEYGYSEKRAEDIGKARACYSKGQMPVAKDTNKTRRKMVKPTAKGAY
jgi:hypothetical protein